MRVESLPSPGLLSNGIRLRIEAAKAISAAEIVAGRTPGGRTIAAQTLRSFFTACSNALAGIADSSDPIFATYQRTATNTVVLSSASVLDETVLPLASAFVFTPARTVTNVVISGTSVTITATGATAGDSLTYTKPATNALRDQAGRQVATFTQVIA